MDDRPDQLGVVTDEPDRMTHQLGAVGGVVSWSRHSYTADLLRHRSFRGTEGQFESRIAVSPGGGLGVVQPVRGVFTQHVVTPRGIGHQTPRPGLLSGHDRRVFPQDRLAVRAKVQWLHAA